MTALSPVADTPKWRKPAWIKAFQRFDSDKLYMFHRVPKFPPGMDNHPCPHKCGQPYGPGVVPHTSPRFNLAPWTTTLAHTACGQPCGLGGGSPPDKLATYYFSKKREPGCSPDKQMGGGVLLACYAKDRPKRSGMCRRLADMRARRRTAKPHWGTNAPPSGGLDIPTALAFLAVGVGRVSRVV